VLPLGRAVLRQSKIAGKILKDSMVFSVYNRLVLNNELWHSAILKAKHLRAKDYGILLCHANRYNKRSAILFAPGCNYNIAVATMVAVFA
jgi:hypothetical protein